MTQDHPAPDPFGPFLAPHWLSPAARLVLGAGIVAPLAANLLFWLLAAAVMSAVGHDVTWAYWVIGGTLVLSAVSSLIAYGRKHTIGLAGIAWSILILIPALAAWGVGVFAALLVLFGGTE